ncbi:MAG: LPS export ABC transporter periplasmic protein LptC [Pseudomonadota bacterium]
MKKILKKHWPLMGIGLLVIVVLYYIAKGYVGIFHDPLIRGLIPKEGVHLENIHFTQDGPDDRMRWILDAKQAQFSKDRSLISFHEFKIRLETENRPFINLTGQKGDYNQSTGFLDLQGNLLGETEDGYSVLAERLLYEHGQGLLKSDQFVRITGPFFSLEGKGLYCDIEKEVLTLSANVTAVIDKKGLNL